MVPDTEPTSERASSPRPAPAWEEAARGELRRATALAGAVLDDRDATGEAAAGAHLALGIVAWARDRLADATMEVDAAVAAAERAHRRGLALMARLQGVLVASSAGRRVEAIGTVIDLHRTIGDHPRAAALRPLVDVVDAAVHLAGGGVDRAEALFDRLPPSADRTLLGARVALERARFATALHRAEEILRAEPLDRRTRVEALLIASLADDARGEHEAARRRRAVCAELTVPEGHVRTYLDLGVTPPDEAGHPARPEAGWVVLSQRERQVLRHLQVRLDNGEIGEAMYISVNTVKTHLQSIYRKLGVESRRQAVERAIELGLL